MKRLDRIGAAALLAGMLAAASGALAQDDPCARRDEGLALIGWVAGNSYDSYLWPQVRQYAGVTGHDYLSLSSAGCSGATLDDEAKASYRLYEKAFAEGRAEAFDKEEALSRLRQAQEITQKLRDRYR